MGQLNHQLMSGARPASDGADGTRIDIESSSVMLSDDARVASRKPHARSVRPDRDGIVPDDKRLIQADKRKELHTLDAVMNEGCSIGGTCPVIPIASKYASMDEACGIAAVRVAEAMRLGVSLRAIIGMKLPGAMDGTIEPPPPCDWHALALAAEIPWSPAPSEA